MIEALIVIVIILAVLVRVLFRKINELNSKIRRLDDRTKWLNEQVFNIVDMNKKIIGNVDDIIDILADMKGVKR